MMGPMSQSLPGSPCRLGTYSYPPYDQEAYGDADHAKRGWTLFRSKKPRHRNSDEVLISYQQQEMAAMRQRLEHQDGEIQRLQAALGQEAGAEGELHERLNFVVFKYQLLIDMWALRVLDNEELGTRREVASAGTSDRLVDLRPSPRP